MRVLQLGRELNFATKALIADFRRDLGVQHFYHYRPLERVVLRDEDAAHPAAAQLALDCVLLAERGFEGVFQLRRRGRK